MHGKLQFATSPAHRNVWIAMHFATAAHLVFNALARLWSCANARATCKFTRHAHKFKCLFQNYMLNSAQGKDAWRVDSGREGANSTRDEHIQCICESVIDVAWPWSWLFFFSSCYSLILSPCSVAHTHTKHIRFRFYDGKKHLEPWLKFKCDSGTVDGCFALCWHQIRKASAVRRLRRHDGAEATQRQRPCSHRIECIKIYIKKKRPKMITATNRWVSTGNPVVISQCTTNRNEVPSCASTDRVEMHF